MILIIIGRTWEIITEIKRHPYVPDDNALIILLPFQPSVNQIITSKYHYANDANDYLVFQPSQSVLKLDPKRPWGWEKICHFCRIFLPATEMLMSYLSFFACRADELCSLLLRYYYPPPPLKKKKKTLSTIKLKKNFLRWQKPLQTTRFLFTSRSRRKKKDHLKNKWLSGSPVPSTTHHF